MITNNEIKKVVDLFKDRQISLYHACQLQDFEAYLAIGGIPSREKLEGKKLSYTPYVTDDVDRINGVWDKVFVNLADFGKTFANGGNATPNTFGPILLEINPVALNNATDVAITLRSAGASDFNREEESLSSVEEVDQLFCYPRFGPGPVDRIKRKEKLQQDFHSTVAINPEMNCSFPNEFIPIQYIRRIIVDPYNFDIEGGEPLKSYVTQMLKQNHLRVELKSRYCKCNPRLALYNEIVGILYREVPSSQQILTSEGSSAEMKCWIEQIQQKGLEYQFTRFAKYLREGTIYPILSMINC